MDSIQTIDCGLLDGAGLNRRAVFNIEDLPEDIVGPVMKDWREDVSCRQLILIGHAGRMLWERVRISGIASDDPIDDFTVDTVKKWFAACQPDNRYRIIYPGSQSVGLQRLGQLAGWHNPSPFMVGIDPEWGTWYAYRAVVLADTAFEPTRVIPGESPCGTCEERVCIGACPGGALAGEGFDFRRCVAYRRQEQSGCRSTCLARVSCPVGSQHRYCDEQLHHSYSRSLQVIERYL